jgi:predicted RNase H-like HicB family nuclease
MAYTYRVVLLHERDGRYSAIVPALEVASWGDTVPEALRRVEEALAGHIECMRRHGDLVPADSETFTVDMGDATEAHVYEVTVPAEEEAASVA